MINRLIGFKVRVTVIIITIRKVTELAEVHHVRLLYVRYAF